MPSEIYKGGLARGIRGRAVQLCRHGEELSAVGLWLPPGCGQAQLTSRGGSSSAVLVHAKTE